MALNLRPIVLMNLLVLHKNIFMSKRLSILLVFSLLFSLTSCKVSKEYVQYVSKKEEIINPSTKKALIFVSGDIQINEFTKTFDKNYKDKSEFVSSFLNDFKEQVAANNLFVEVYLDSESQTYDEINKVDEDYIIRFSNVEISNRVEWTGGGGFGVNGVGVQAPSSVEYCVIKAKVEVYDGKNDKEILDFIVTGEASVFLFNFTKTFNTAKERTIKHVVNYLKSGTTTYEKY